MTRPRSIINILATTNSLMFQFFPIFPDFVFSPAGDELSWLAPNLGVWYGGLLLRDAQFRAWLGTGRPNSFWMAGFFNPQGFITAVQQEITRAHKNDNWALDSVMLHSEVTDISNIDNIKHHPKVNQLLPL